MKKVGMLVAIEIDAVLKQFGKSQEPITVTGYKIYKYNLENAELFVIHSGAGEIAAASATQLLISVFNVEVLINFGVVGGLTPEMSLARTCIVEKVVHYDFDTSDFDHCEVGRYMDYPDIFIPTTPEIIAKALILEPTLKRVICASGDKFIGSKEKKQNLHNKFKADICEMEAAGVVLTCNRNKIPCLLIKTVSDSIEGGADEFRQAVNDSACICLNVVNKIIADI